MALLYLSTPARLTVWRTLFEAAGETLIEGEAAVTDPSEVTAIACWMPPEDLSRYPNLRAVISVGAGVDQMPPLPTGVALSRTLAPGIEEMVRDWVVMATLMLHRDLPAYLDQAQRGEWRPHPVRLAPSRRVGILGMGRIGSLAAESLRGLGFEVAGLSRSGQAGGQSGAPSGGHSGGQPAGQSEGQPEGIPAGQSGAQPGDRSVGQSEGQSAAQSAGGLASRSAGHAAAQSTEHAAAQSSAQAATPSAGQPGRTPEGPAEAVTMYPASDVEGFLGRSDILVCLLPLTEATRGILNDRTLSALPRGAALVHAGRGAQLDDAALLRALDSGGISAAMLDVTDPEPLPSDHWIWRDPRVILTPHVAAQTDAAEGARHALDVLRALREGAPLPGRVDPARGY